MFQVLEYLKEFAIAEEGKKDNVAEAQAFALALKQMRGMGIQVPPNI